MLHRTAWSLCALLCLIGPTGWSNAAITISGLQDRKVYADRVAFTIQSEAGFEYTAQLNGKPVTVGTSVTVVKPTK
jgi:hypothetical protein